VSVQFTVIASTRNQKTARSRGSRYPANAEGIMFSTRKVVITASAACFVLLLSTSSVTAGRLDFEVITPYNSNGFSASWYHTASSSMDVGGVKYYAAGTKLLGLSGIIRTNQDDRCADLSPV